MAAAISLDVTRAEPVRVARSAPATLFARGTVDEIGTEIAALDPEDAPEVVIVDAALSPVQQRNLERRWEVKVIDRTGLILEIFGERARTREGQLQVELAHLSYQRSRLVRSWTHLERQKGGAGFMGGPGERQIELDRRLIDDRIVQLKKDLESVRRTRSLHRGARRRVPYPIIALVGYTNAGKSTLFNRLTRASVFAEDLLFATLDPTMRKIPLGRARHAIASDTVGFISDLPTDLVAAFRATLEEVEEADLILHVRDVAHPDTEIQRADVNAVLTDLGIDVSSDERVVEILNKVDLLPDAERSALDGHATAISALTGAGCDALLDHLADRLAARHATVWVTVDISDGKTLAWLHDRGEVLKRHDGEQSIDLCVRLDPMELGRLRGILPPDRIHDVDVTDQLADQPAAGGPVQTVNA